MTAKSNDYVPGISAEAVQRVTGRTWQEWFEVLDAAGAADMSHKEIVSWLRDQAGVASGWWQQGVTVEYEKARGKRAEVGETADVGFQVGAQRTLAIPAARAWELLLAGPGRDAWLGASESFRLEPGEHYETADGTRGEVRTVRPGRRVRLTWQPKTWSRPSTLQLDLTDKGERCTVGFHHERLADAATRQAMREHWRDVLDTLRTLAHAG
ncbi:MAG: SRPBCC domain-containing protein [Trueperaceae bacterium]